MSKYTTKRGERFIKSADNSRDFRSIQGENNGESKIFYKLLMSRKLAVVEVSRKIFENFIPAISYYPFEGTRLAEDHQVERFKIQNRFGRCDQTSKTALGISQDELARRSGLHRTYVSDLERGARNPSVGSVQKIALVLHVPVSKLFETNKNGKP